jgi:hypothetical protein
MDASKVMVFNHYCARSVQSHRITRAVPADYKGVLHAPAVRTALALKLRMRERQLFDTVKPFTAYGTSTKVEQELPIGLQYWTVPLLKGLKLRQRRGLVTNGRGQVMPERKKKGQERLFHAL